MAAGDAPCDTRAMIRLGLISDTHGILRPDALEALAGVDEILHAGDVGSAGVLEQLATVAPLLAVAGNMDPHLGPLGTLPGERLIERAGHRLLLLHDPGGLYRPSHDVIARARLDRATLVVHGHTHRPADETWGGVRFVNPGAASHARGGHPPSVARMTLRPGAVAVSFVELEP